VIQQVAIYARVSTDQQITDRQVADLTAYAERCGYTVMETVLETASGAKNDRKGRAKVMQLARHRKIQAVLVTELSRWGRSTQDLLSTLHDLTAWNVSLLALNGMTVDLSTATGKLLVTMLAGISEFERDLLTERINSGVKAAKAKGVHCGRPAGKDLSHDQRVMELIASGMSRRKIAKQENLAPTTVQAIATRNR
jgi:DNA invertase Pin-like site-specific DNA recombinase